MQIKINNYNKKFYNLLNHHKKIYKNIQTNKLLEYKKNYNTIQNNKLLEYEKKFFYLWKVENFFDFITLFLKI
uniref:Uncharacterized protein n=1 Tax=viral metagenome TaxID=1070528 RepID=A0A6C0EIN8_9ZZZZ